MKRYVLQADGGNVTLEPIGDAEPADDPKAPKGPQHPLKFHLDSDLFERLETARRSAVVRLPRNTWILQAIAEKLEREGH
jgi:hypothetical protein